MVYDCWEETVGQYNKIIFCRSKHELPKANSSDAMKDALRKTSK